MTNYIGAVFYEDDMRVFRIVYPVEGDPPNILEDPRWFVSGHCDDKSCPCAGLDVRRRARLAKVDLDDHRWRDKFASVAKSIDPGGLRV